MPNNNYRGPTFDEMRSGEIYAAGGQGGYDPSAQGYMDPSYTIPQPRDEVSNILDESGYTDMMRQKEEGKRKKHIEKIMELTGVKKIAGAEQYTQKADPEKAKIWKTLPEQDKMMVSSVAEGKMQPQEFRDLKIQQSEQKKKQMLDFLKIAAQEGGVLTGEGGKKIGTTARNVEQLLGGEDVAATFKGGTSTVRQYYSGGGGGGGGGKGAGDPSGRLEKASVSQAQVDKISDQQSKLISTVYDDNGNPIKTPLSKENQKKYDEYEQDKVPFKIAAINEELGIPTLSAQANARKILGDVSFISDPEGGMIVANKLNILNPQVLRALARAAQNPALGMTADKIYTRIQKDIAGRDPGPYLEGYNQ